MSNQKGFTIVELLIGMVILSIVTAALTGFIVSSSKSYAASNTEIVVQQESQLAMNQISDVVIDTTRSVNYTGYSLDKSKSEQVLKDSEFTFTPGDKCLTLYNGEAKQELEADGSPKLDADGKPVFTVGASGNGNQNYQIYWSKDDEKLVFSQTDISDITFKDAEQYVLAEFVKDFSVDLSQVEEKRVVKVTITYEYNNRTFETSNNITIRNKVLVNDVDLEVDRTVKMQIRPKESVVILEPNEDYKFSTPIVTGSNIIDKSVTWSIADEPDKPKPDMPDTAITENINGRIHISSKEKAGTTGYFYVKIEANAKDEAGEPLDVAYVQVYVKRATDVTLTKTGDTSDPEMKTVGAKEIVADSTVTISVTNVEGAKIGYTCSGCGDDVTIDKQVIATTGMKYFGWAVDDPNGIFDGFVSTDNTKADVKIKSTAQPGNTITIYATSLLSVTDHTGGRHYEKPDGTGQDRVTGSITLTVKKKDNSYLHVPDGGLNYGNDPFKVDWWTPTGATAVIAVRIQTTHEDGKPDQPERVILFDRADGNNLAFLIDSLGLNLNREYDISIQALDLPVDKTIIVDGEEVTVDAKYIVDEYNGENNPNSERGKGHINADGCYVGNIPASEMSIGHIYKPQIYITYNGTTTSSELTLDSINALAGWVTVNCPVTRISSMQSNAGIDAKNAAKADLYLQPGNPSDILYRGNGQNDGLSSSRGSFKYGECELGAAQKLKVYLDGNVKDPGAAGKYYYLPYFTYDNATAGGRFVDSTDSTDSATDEGSFVAWANYTPGKSLEAVDTKLAKLPGYTSGCEKGFGYGVQTCYGNKINFTIIGGPNLKGVVTYPTDDNALRRGDIYFPTPSESKFQEYFDLDSLKDGEVHSSIKGMETTIYLGNNQSKTASFTKMTCQLDGNKYKIKLFYSVKDELFGKYIVTSTGTFVCDADGDEWIPDANDPSGPLDTTWLNQQVRGVGNVKITIDTYEGNTYIPLPTDNEFFTTFGFTKDSIKSGVPQITYNNGNYGSITYRGQGGDTPQAAYRKAKCSYDKETKTYTFELDIAKNQADFGKAGQDWVSTFTFTEGDATWTKVDKKN